MLSSPGFWKTYQRIALYLIFTSQTRNLLRLPAGGNSVVAAYSPGFTFMFTPGEGQDLQISEIVVGRQKFIRLGQIWTTLRSSSVFCWGVGRAVRTWKSVQKRKIIQSLGRVGTGRGSLSKCTTFRAISCQYRTSTGGVFLKGILLNK